jgi:uncharacterized protein YutE (UPF0331/DUF86 family)
MAVSMADDVILNKADIIERCLQRIAQEYAGNPDNLRKHLTKQDSILLNLERACQAAIDMAMRAVKLRKLGLPKESREAFDLLLQAGLIDAGLCRRMHGLVGFRDTAVHNYKKLDLDIVEAILLKHLGDFREFERVIIKSI